MLFEELLSFTDEELVDVLELCEEELDISDWQVDSGGLQTMDSVRDVLTTRRSGDKRKSDLYAHD